MNLEKICEALSGTDELGWNIFSGCALGQLFFAAGKSVDELKREKKCTAKVMGHIKYENMFDGLLRKEYGMSAIDVWKMVDCNDNSSLNEYPKARHQRVLAHYESELIEELIAEPMEEKVHEYC